MKVAEAQGAMVGSTFLLVSGFYNLFQFATNNVYTLDTANVNATWQAQDKLPARLGITHAAFVAIGTKFYMCGGYVGGNPGRHTNQCFVMDLSKPRRQQWTRFEALPNGGRAGGGMVYDSKLDALIFAGGAQRPILNSVAAIDFNTTWMYSFKTSNTTGWVPKASIPFQGNHLSFVTVQTDASRTERHFFAGGQDRENEKNGNYDYHFEYDAQTDVWMQRRAMTIARGHASSSTRAVGCGGYLMAGGATNGGLQTADISYYHIATDTWTSIGNLTTPINTPVCVVSANNNVLYCESGSVTRTVSQTIQLVGV